MLCHNLRKILLGLVNGLVIGIITGIAVGMIYHSVYLEYYHIVSYGWKFDSFWYFWIISSVSVTKS